MMRSEIVISLEKLNKYHAHCQVLRVRFSALKEGLA